MNTDKIYAESIAKDYAPKDNSKIVALKSWMPRQSSPLPFSPTPSASLPLWWQASVCASPCRSSAAA